MWSASDGHACHGGWRHLYVNPQAKLHGQVGVLFSDPATNTGGQRRVAGADQTQHVAQMRAGGLSDIAQLDTVLRHVRQLPAASGSTGQANQGSLTDASWRRRVRSQQLTESSRRISDKHMTRPSSLSGSTDGRSESRRGVTTNSNKSSWSPARGVTTNSNNSCVTVPPPLPPVCPDTTTSAEQLLLGPDHIDMLLALAASNCTGNEMVGCCKMALQSSHVGNILRNYLVAVKYRLQDVMDKMINVIRRNFLCISRSREFLSLPLEYILVSNSKLIFMEDTHLNVQNELDMFVTGLLWIDYNKQERIDYAGRVLKCVRYAHIAPGDILQYVEPNLHLFTGQDGAETLVNLYKHHAFTQSGQPVPGYSSMIPPRRGMHGVPARAYITSGGPDMHPVSGYGGLTCRAQRGPGAVPTDAASSSMRWQKTKVTFAPNTQFSPGDTPQQSQSQLQTAASPAPAGETPAAGAEKGATTPEKGAATPEKGAATAEKGAATLEKGAATPEKGAATAEKGAATPEKGAATAEKGAATPENGAATPEKGAATAETGAAIPEKGAATPEKGAAAPEKGTATPEKGTAAPEKGTATAEKGSATAEKGVATAEKGANAPAVGDKQPEKAVTTTVAADAQSGPAVNSAATSGKPPENVQDRSNNSRLWAASCGSWVYGDESLLAWQAGRQQWLPSCQSGIEARFNPIGPSRASHVGHTMASGCHDLYMTTSGCQNHSRVASGCQNHSRLASGCQNHFRVASGYGQYPTMPSGCHSHPMVASDYQNHFMAACVAGQGWGHPVKGQPIAHDTRHSPNRCTAGQYPAVLETDAGRKRTSSLQYVSEQCQQLSSKQSHQKQVFMVTRNLSGPVVSIAYPQDDDTQVS